MIFRIPTIDKKIAIEHNGEIKAGNIFATWNIDLTSERGRIKVSHKTTTLSSSTDDPQLTYPVGLKRSAADATDRWWLLCHQALFKTSSGDPSAFTQDAIASSPTTQLSHIYSDIEDFNGALIVTLDNGDIARLSSGTWSLVWWITTLAQTALSTSVPHPIKRGFNNLLAIGDGQYVHTVDINSNVFYKRLNFGVEYEIMWIKSSPTMYWFGTRHKYGGRAKVFGWDGWSDNFTEDHEIDGTICFSGVIKDGIPWVIDNTGQLKKYVGYGFKEVAHFPWYRFKRQWKDNYTLTQSVSKNGMDIIDGNIHILLNAKLNGGSSDHMEGSHSGIWEYDEEFGLYHKYGIIQNNSNDFGVPAINKGGVLVKTDDENGKFMAGVTLHTNAFTTLFHHVVKLNTPSSTTLPTEIRRGYIITPKLFSENIEETYQRVFVKFRSYFVSASDKLIIKYRKFRKNFRDFEVGQIGTWVTATTFTTTISEFSNAAVGDEIEILSGFGAGASAKITIISLVAGTYTVTIDQSIGTTSTNFSFKIANWTKLAEFACNVADFNQTAKIMDESTEAQVKVELVSVGDSLVLHELVIPTERHTPIQ